MRGGSLMLDESIRTAILDVTELSDRVGGNRVAENNAQAAWLREGGPYVVYLRRSTDGEHTLDSAPGEEPFRQYFDVECYGTDVAKVDELAEAIKRTMNLYRGNFGQGSVQGVFINDHTDDYQSRVNIADAGLHGAFLDMQIAGYSE